MSRKHQVTADTAAWLGVANHIALAAFKGTIGFLFDSRALQAAALHSFSDAAVMVSNQLNRYNRRSNNELSPAKQPLFVIFLSVFILMGCFHTLIVSIASVLSEDPSPPGYWAGVAIVISIGLKEALFQYQYRKYRGGSTKLEQSLIETHRFSLYSSVAVLIGVFGSMFGQARGIPILLYLDPAAAILVAVLVIWRVYILVRRTITDSMKSELKMEDPTPYMDTLQKVRGVITVLDLKAWKNGYYISISAVISVNPRITMIEANEIADRAKLLLMHRYSHISDASIYVLPYDPGYPYKSNLDGSGDEQPTLIQ